jgi:amino acid adenylation domain-containing protein
MAFTLTDREDRRSARLRGRWPVASGQPNERCVPRLFEAWAQATPESTALVCGDERLNYDELNRCANRMAHHLQGRGVGPGDLVGVSLHRCVDMIVSMLGVLKTGAAYIPIDPSYPTARVQAMLEEVELAALLTWEEHMSKLSSSRAELVCVDREREGVEAEPDTNLDGASPEHLAYVIFTSGSTGQAKAAAVHHKGWMNLLDWFVEEFDICAIDRVLVMSSFSFDITQRSIAMPLVSGGQLHLLDSRIYDPELIRQTMARESITLVNCAPSTFYPLVESSSGEHARMSTLRVAFLGGEPISASRLLGWASSPECFTEVVNVYGVAECSDVSTFYRLRDYERYAETSVPIGTPISATQVHLLDDELKPVGPGEPGEICISGVGVGAGYINDPLLTETKFVPDPYAATPAERMYRTGDLGRMRQDETLELIGRVDFQIKIRGHRIDPGDVETSLRQHPAVREAVVLGKSYASGDVRLIAFVVPKQDGCVENDLIQTLRETLMSRLPEHMMPARFAILPELPMNPNGKVDRTALSQWKPTAHQLAPEDAPRTDRERQVASTFADVLGIDQIGIFDSFFDHGGDSYLATVLLGQLTQDSGVRLSIIDLLDGPTVAAVAQAIETADGD